MGGDTPYRSQWKDKKKKQKHGFPTKTFGNDRKRRSSPLNASIRGPQYLKPKKKQKHGFPIKDFGNDEGGGCPPKFQAWQEKWNPPEDKNEIAPPSQEQQGKFTKRGKKTTGRLQPEKGFTEFRGGFKRKQKSHRFRQTLAFSFSHLARNFRMDFHSKALSFLSFKQKLFLPSSGLTPQNRWQ